MNSRVERMFGARESWGEGNERERVEAGKAARSKGDTSSTAARSPSPKGEGKKAEAARGTSSTAARSPSPKGEGEGVKGFVSIRCGGCGKIVNTCLHERRTIFNCKDCGHPNPLEGLKTMKVECPRCSFRGLYQTNREESSVVMECLNCSQPVPLRKGKRRGNYVTVKEERR